MPDWMIYGATGYTGQLVAEAAVAGGHRPLLAGRSVGKLQPLAERLNLDYVAVDLEDAAALAQAVSRVKLVYHAAGPFIHTSAPMLRACLNSGAHYLDITGEIPVFQQVFSHHEAAQERGIALLPGVGFDVIPSDCLLKHVADQLPDATHAEVALGALGSDSRPAISAGTAQSMLELMGSLGNVARRDSQLVAQPLGAGAKAFRFRHGERLALPIPWGDVETGYRSTGIPNITTYMTIAPSSIRAARLAGPLLTSLLQMEGLRRFLNRQIARHVTGPDEMARLGGRSHLVARVWNAAGEQREAWLETLEGYHFTAQAAVPVVERVLNGALRGAMTPSLAFGVDFVLSIGNTQRHDAL